MGTSTLDLWFSWVWSDEKSRKYGEALAKEALGNDSVVKKAVRKWLDEVGRDFSAVALEMLGHCMTNV